jgi:hypothetical protein
MFKMIKVFNFVKISFINLLRNMHQTFSRLFKFVSTFFTIGANESYPFSYVHRWIWVSVLSICREFMCLKDTLINKIHLFFHFEMQQLPNERNLFMGLPNSRYEVCTPKKIKLVPRKHGRACPIHDMKFAHPKK